jgi:hypothetical protein
MTDYSTKSVLVIDSGLFVSLAERLVGQFSKVGYFCEWQTSFPDGRELMIGSGIDGITRVKWLWNEIDDYDLIVFADCWHGDLQDYLRSKGRRVWGAGMKASLELARWNTKTLLKEIGLPSNNAVQIHGIDDLREYLKSHKDVFVKISAFRGIGETFHARNYEQVKGQLDQIESKCGPMSSVMDFVVEENIPDSIEVGYDGYCVEGEFPNQSFVGVEIKDKAYFGKLVDYDSLPQSVRETNTRLSYHMDGYSQFWSTELREKNGKGYVIDLTCRDASPAGEIYCSAFTNLAEILWAGAEKRLVHPVSSARFGAQIILTSEWAECHWQDVEFPESIRPFVSLYNHCRIEDEDYVIPQVAKMRQIGSVIGLGNTPEEAIKLARERADQVSGFDIESEYDSLDKAREQLDALKITP